MKVIKLLLKLAIIASLLVTSAGQSYALRPPATNTLGYLQHIKNIDVYVGCQYIQFGRFGEIAKGTLWAKELSRRFPDKHIRLVLHTPSIPKAQKLAGETLEKFWPENIRSERNPNVEVIEVSAKENGLDEKFSQADLGILINFADARSFNFPAPKMELLVSLNDVEHGRLYADSIEEDSMLKFGLGPGRLGLLLEDELLERSKEQMSKEALCDRLKQAQVNPIFEDAQAVSKIINTKWSIISAHTADCFKYFLELMERYRTENEEISIFVCGKSATGKIFANEYDFLKVYSEFLPDIGIIDIDGQRQGGNHAKITLCFLNTVPWELMMPLYRNCEKPVLVRGERPLWEASLAGVPWLYEAEHWNTGHFEALCSAFESQGETEIAAALRAFAEGAGDKLNESALRAIGPLFKNPEIGSGYLKVASYLFQHANFLSGDKLESALEDKASQFFTREGQWLAAISRVARIIKKTQFPLKFPIEEAQRQLRWSILSEKDISVQVMQVEDIRYKHGNTDMVDRYFLIIDKDTGRQAVITLFPDGSVEYGKTAVPQQDKSGNDAVKSSSAGNKVVSAMAEEEFIRSIKELTFEKFQFFIYDIMKNWEETGAQNDWGAFLMYLRHYTDNFNDQLIANDDNWGLQKIAESIDMGWAQSEKWKRYERSFRYKMRYFVQEAYGRGLTLRHSKQWSEPDERLYNNIASSIESLVAGIGILGAELMRLGKKEIPVTSTALSDPEWERLLKLQDEYWNYFQPIGEMGVPLYWPAVRGVFAASPLLDSAELMKIAGIDKNSRIADLGAGKADPCAVAGVIFYARAIGYEFNSASLEIGQEWIQHLEGDDVGLIRRGRVSMSGKDYKQAPLDRFTHLYVYPSSGVQCGKIDEWIIRQDIKEGVKLIIYANTSYCSGGNEAGLLFPQLAKDRRWEMRLIPGLNSFIFERKKEGLSGPSVESVKILHRIHSCA